MVRDGARAGGGKAGPNPQPLSQRLSGLRAATAGEMEAGDIGCLTSDAPSKGVEQGEEKEGGAGAAGLRLDGPGEPPRGPEEDNGSPSRGPPKTPKRNKASSPQLTDVSVGFLRFKPKCASTPRSSSFFAPGCLQLSRTSIHLRVFSCDVLLILLATPVVLLLSLRSREMAKTSWSP